MIDGQESEFVTGLASNAESGSTGNAGTIEVAITEWATIRNGGIVGSGTFSGGDAGNITLTANQLLIDRQGSEFVTGLSSGANVGSTGNAGIINVAIAELAIIQNGGTIGSSTFSAGNAGNVLLSANQLMIDRQDSEFITGLFSDAYTSSTGNAGSIEVTIAELATIQNGGTIRSITLIGSTGNAGTIEVAIVELATIQNGGTISSTTSSEGVAGNIRLTANQLLIDGQDSGFVTGLVSDANIGSTGNAGSIEVVIAESATMQNDSVISSSADNSNAGSVTINSTGSVTIDNVTVSTESVGGIAGPINIVAGSSLNTRNAQITTNTGSLDDDGGNISIQSGALILEDTVIQANADSGSGGAIEVVSDVVIPFGNQLDTESTSRLVLFDSFGNPINRPTGNVIQAVAPNGVTVSPTISAPETDISAALIELNADPNTPSVASDPCASFTAGAPSSLVEAGRGALPVTSTTITKLSTTTPQVSDAEYPYPFTSDDSDAKGDAQAGCRSDG